MDDRALGEQLVAGRIITPEQLEKCLAIQRDLAAMGVARGLDDVLRDQKMIGAGPAQPLSTVPPNSLRRVKCHHCGARVLVQPGQHERDVVCKQCGESVVAQPRAPSGRSPAGTPEVRGTADADFEPTLPTLELLSGASRLAADQPDLELPTIPRFSTDATRASTSEDEQPTNRTNAPAASPSSSPARSDTGEREVLGGREPPRASDDARSRRRDSSSAAALRGTRAGPGARRKRSSSGSSPAHGGSRGSSGATGLILAVCTLVVVVTAAALFYLGRDDHGNPANDPTTPGPKNVTPPDPTPPTPPPQPAWEVALGQYHQACAKDDERSAFTALLRYIELKPDDGERRRALVELGVKLDETDALLPHLEAMIASGRDRAWALRIASDVHARAGRPADAIAALEQAIALEPTGELRARLARKYFEHRQIDKFLEHFEKLDLDESHFETLADLKPALRTSLFEHLGPVFKGNQVAAQQTAATRGPKLASFDPEFWFYHLLCGIHAGTMGRDNPSVVAAMDKAVDLFPPGDRDPTFLVVALNYRSWAQFKLKQYDLAIADGRRAIELCEAPLAMSVFTTILNAVYAQKKGETFRRLLTVYSWCADSYQAKNAGLEQFRQGLKALTNTEHLADPDDAIKAAQFYLVVTTDATGSPLLRADKVLKVAGQPIQNTRTVYQSWIDLDAKRDPAATLTVVVERGESEVVVVIPSAQLRATSEQFRTGFMQLRLRSLD